MWNQALAGYNCTLRAAGKSPRTWRTYRSYLVQVAALADNPAAITVEDLREYLADQDWKPETRRSARTAIRGFFQWLQDEGYIIENPAARLDPVKVPAATPRPTSTPAMQQALGDAGPRERLMLLLGATAGLRRSEIAAVHSRDFDPLEGLLTVAGKGGKIREIPIVHPELIRALTECAGWLFPGRVNGHLSAGHVGVLLGRVLPGRYTAHTLRHRAASKAYAGTRDLLAVGQMLGHSKPETTKRYIRLPQDALREAASAAAAYV